MTVRAALAMLALVACVAHGAPMQGYLADKFCINGRFAPDGADMLLRPYDHSVGCALLDQCIASGFVLLMFTRGSTPTQYGQMYNFTASGNTMAVDFLRLFKDHSRKDILVEIDGTAAANGLFQPTYIKDTQSAVAMGQVPVLTGYLADRYCIDRIIAPDGANMLTGPQEHSVMCALLPPCIASGWSLITDSPNPLRTTYGVLYNFSTGSQHLGLDMMLALNRTVGSQKKDIYVAITGTVSTGGVLTVTSITETRTNTAVVVSSAASSLAASAFLLFLLSTAVCVLLA
jgi:hypothetical protein